LLPQTPAHRLAASMMPAARCRPASLRSIAPVRLAYRQQCGRHRPELRQIL